jgi:hypothetical protein
MRPKGRDVPKVAFASSHSYLQVIHLQPRIARLDGSKIALDGASARRDVERGRHSYLVG